MPPPTPLTNGRLARPGARGLPRLCAKRVRPALPQQLNRRAPLTDADADGGPPPTTDWGALAFDADADSPPSSSTSSTTTIDPDVAISINELATVAARAMLAGDERALRAGGAWRAEVMALGDHCTQQARRRAGGGGDGPPDPASPAMQGALLAYLLLEMADGRWPTAQADALVGPWRAAAEKMHGIVEDAGWKLSLPDEEEEA